MARPRQFRKERTDDAAASAMEARELGLQLGHRPRQVPKRDISAYHLVGEPGRRDIALDEPVQPFPRRTLHLCDLPVLIERAFFQ